MKTQIAIADENLQLLKANSYPGRGMSLGMDQTGTHLVQVYWIMGRGKDSRNRVFSIDGGRVYTEAANPATMQSTANIIYDAMEQSGSSAFVVSNGTQTNAVVDGWANGIPLRGVLDDWEYESDAPNFTPRITGVCYRWTKPCIYLSILRKCEGSNQCDRFYFEYNGLVPGLGRCITTYTGDGNPLPPFYRRTVHFAHVWQPGCNCPDVLGRAQSGQQGCARGEVHLTGNRKDHNHGHQQVAEGGLIGSVPSSSSHPEWISGCDFLFLKSCAPTWIRTKDPLLKRELLYHLSYGRKRGANNECTHSLFVRAQRPDECMGAP